MSSDRPPPPSSRPSSSSISGPYQPKNSLHSNIQPSYPPIEAINIVDSPKFGHTTPLKSALPPANSGSSWNVGPVAYPTSTSSDTEQYVSKIIERRKDFMKPVKIGDKEQWRKAIGLDAEPHASLRDPQIISRPSAFPTFARQPFGNSDQNLNGLNPVNRGDFVDLTKNDLFISQGRVDFITRPTYGGYQDDHMNSHDAIKELLSAADGTQPRKKKSRKQDEDISTMMEGAKLDDDDEDEDDEEGDEEDDQEDQTHVPGLNVKLLPHQVKGLAFMNGRETGKKNFGGILADDMGLGKTIQSISLILSHHHPLYPIADGQVVSPASKKKIKEAIASEIVRGTLVVAPLSLIRQWEGEIAKRTEPTHRLRVKVHHGPKRSTDPRELRKYDVVITTYDVIRSEHQKSEGDDETAAEPVGVFGLYWWRIICDEAHIIKNRLAKQTKAASALKAKYRWCLTGTPVQNNVDELQSLIHFLRIRPFDEPAIWKEQITRPMQQNKNRVAIQRLRTILGAIMIRRTKDVLRSEADNKMALPERKVQPMATTFSESEKKFYEKLEDRTMENFNKLVNEAEARGAKASMTSALTLLLRLRQACNHPQLLAGTIHEDKEAGIGLATPRKKKVPLTAHEDAAEEDLLAGLMGGLSVDQNKCEVCLAALTREEKDAGEIRCTACNEDIQAFEVKDVGKSRKKQKRRSSKPIIINSDDEDITRVKPLRRKKMVVLDSDDEEAESENEESAGEEPHDESSNSLYHSQAEESDCEESGAEQDPSRGGEDNDDNDENYDGPSDDDSPTLLGSTKIHHLMEIIRKEQEQKNKMIVFSQFTSMLTLIEPFLRRENIKYVRYDGSMKNDDREAALRALRGEGEFALRKGNDSWCGVMLCSLKCGALGLNLIAACRVVMLEPFWNPFVEEQAIDRVHRYGQTKDVIVYKLTIADSIEERMLKLQDEKRQIAKDVMGDGKIKKGKSAKLDMKDIMRLFSHSAEHAEDDLGPRRAPKLRMLKETSTHTPRDDILVRRKILSPEEEAHQEARRAREMSNAFGRR